MPWLQQAKKILREHASACGPVQSPVAEWQRSLGGASRIVYLAVMKLADFLFESGMSTTQLRRALNIRCRSTITRYLHGDRVPNPVTMQRIIDLTGGKVQLQDFLRGGNPKCATIITLPSGRKKLVFPWANRESDLEAAEAVESRRAANDDGISPPLRAALDVLRERARLGPRGWLLDNRPADTTRIIREANRVLDDAGEPLIRYPGAGG